METGTTLAASKAGPGVEAWEENHVTRRGPFSHHSRQGKPGGEKANTKGSTRKRNEILEREREEEDKEEGRERKRHGDEERRDGQERQRRWGRDDGDGENDDAKRRRKEDRTALAIWLNVNGAPIAASAVASAGASASFVD